MNKLLIRLTVGVTCPYCAREPNPADFLKRLAAPGDVMACDTCGKVNPKRGWLNIVPAAATPEIVQPKGHP